MFQSQKHAFWQALVITIIIFSLGVIFGFVLENWRNSRVEFIYKQSEVDLLDVKLQSDIYSQGEFNCNSAVEENIKFADKIYEEAKQMERYQKASVLTEDLKIWHNKYDILRATVLLNSIRIKQKCNSSYYDVIYLYKYNNPDFDILAKESVFSRLLGELKEKKGSSILLLPIAADSNLSSVNLILDKYNVSQKELPIILINGEIKISEIENINDLEKYFK